MCLDGHAFTSMQAVHRLSLGVTCALLKVNSFFPLFSLTACRIGCLCECTGRGRTKQPRKAIVP